MPFIGHKNTRWFMVPSNLRDLYLHARRVTRIYEEHDKPYVYATPARNALNIARTELALRGAEKDDRIRFEWEYDNDYEPDGDYDLEQERKDLESGKIEALFCIAYVPTLKQPHDCPSCDCEPVASEEIAASLHGITVDVDDIYEYKREVERELAEEAGVI